jgi:SWIM zinc finger
VKNGDGKEYAVSIGDGYVSCSCPDFSYRKVTCKHLVMLAVQLLRAEGRVDKEPVERTFNLKLGKARKGFAFSALLLATFVCSGCTHAELVTGYPLTEKGRVVHEYNKQNTEIAKQRAEILRLYKDCLVRNQHDKSTDCSEFRTALEIVEPKGR